MATKIYAVSDALGLPPRVILSPGHRGDVNFGEALLDGLQPGYVVANKAYDADHFHNTI